MIHHARLSPIPKFESTADILDRLYRAARAQGALVEAAPRPETSPCPSATVSGDPRPILGDDPGSLDRFRRVFATWDFSEGTY